MYFYTEMKRNYLIMPPSKQIIIDAIVKEIEQGTTRAKVIAKYCKKLQKSERTIDSYWKIANIQQKERQEKANKAADEVYIETKVEAVKSGLKSKLEKQLELQKEIEDIDKQIKGLVKFSFPVGSKMMQSHSREDYMNPIQVINDLRKQKLSYIAELNKMEGDYAPTKLEHSGEVIQTIITTSDGKQIIL